MLSSNSPTSPAPTVSAVPITPLALVVTLAWYACCIPPVWPYLCDLPQISSLLDDYPNTLARATSFDNKLTSDALAVTPQNSDYADILALSVRQLFGNIELTAGWDGTTHVKSDIMAFMRSTSFVLAKFRTPANV